MTSGCPMVHSIRLSASPSPTAATSWWRSRKEGARRQLFSVPRWSFSARARWDGGWWWAGEGVLHPAPLFAGRASAPFGGRSWKRTPKQSFGYRAAPGEGDSPRVQLVETAPHPNPLPRRAGRGSTQLLTVADQHIAARGRQL